MKNVLTLGIHTKFWLYRVNREMDGHEGFHLNLPLLGFMVALPIVTPAIVKFQTAARMNSMVSHQVTQPIIRARRLGWLSLVPVLGAGIYAYWVQSTLNRHWFWHRRAERLRRLRERVTELAAQPENEEILARRFELEQEYRALERETEEEVDAARIRMGEEGFRARQERAALHAARGRLSRKEVAELRGATRARRQAEREARRRRLNPRARLIPRRADPEDDEAWRPYTPAPARTPDEIRAEAEAAGRALTKAEQKEIRTAEGLIARGQRETSRLEKRRAALRERAAKVAAKAASRRKKAESKEEKAQEKETAKAEKRRLKTEAKADKQQAKELAKAEKQQAKEEAQRARKAIRAEKAEEKQPQKRPRKQKPLPPPPADEDLLDFEEPAVSAPAPAGAGQAASAVRIVRVRCPRCAQGIDLRKRGDDPAKLTCGNCGLVGRV